jgi:predicted double-glycine peptidase
MLAVPYFKQDTGYSCGAASVQMIARYFGVVASEEELMRTLHTDAVYGTHHQPIIEYVTAIGLYCYVNTESTLAEIAHFLARALPVLVHYIEPSQNEHHYSVAVALTDTHIVLHDPWNGPHFSLTHDEFAKRWYDAEHTFPQWLLVASREDLNLGKLYRPQV